MNTLCYRRINLNIHLMRGAPIFSSNLWTLCAQALVREDIHTLRLTVTSPVRAWIVTLLLIHREYIQFHS